MFGRATSVPRRIRSRTCLLPVGVRWRCTLRRFGRLRGVREGHKEKKAKKTRGQKLTVGVEDGCLEAHLGWQEGVFAGEREARAEEASCTWCQ